MVSPRGREKHRFEDEDDDDYENDKRGRRSDALKSIRIGIKPEPSADVARGGDGAKSGPTSAIPPKSDYKTKPGLR